jgi:hypothetical protein
VPVGKVENLGRFIGLVGSKPCFLKLFVGQASLLLFSTELVRMDELTSGGSFF